MGRPKEDRSVEGGVVVVVVSREGVEDSIEGGVEETEAVHLPRIVENIKAAREMDKMLVEMSIAEVGEEGVAAGDTVVMATEAEEGVVGTQTGEENTMGMEDKPSMTRASSTRMVAPVGGEVDEIVGEEETEDGGEDKGVARGVEATNLNTTKSIIIMVSRQKMQVPTRTTLAPKCHLVSNLI